MIKRIAMIKNGLVENVAIVEEGSDWAPEGFELIDVTDQVEVGPGWAYADGIFTAPPPLILEG